MFIYKYIRPMSNNIDYINVNKKEIHDHDVTHTAMNSFATY